MHEWTFTFLASLRRFNPCISVKCIPFGDDIKRTERLCSDFAVEMYCSESFSELDRIGRSLDLEGSSIGQFWFRRFASFWGCFDSFAYLDCRNLILGDMKPFVESCDVYDLDLVHYDCSLDQVYNAGEIRAGFLRQRRGRGFNSGRWSSRYGVFGQQELAGFAEECLRVRGQMNFRNTDQFFLNYCCDKKRLKTGHFAEFSGDMCQDGWARQPGYVYRAADCYRRWDFGGLNHKKRVPLLHWAGIKLSPAMPEAELFYSFRDAEFGWFKRSCRRLGRILQRPILKLFRGLRANRWINETYHRLRGK